MRGALGPRVARIEHVGSTAVPGLAALPVIDLDVVLADPAGRPGAIARLGAIGYAHEGELGIPGRDAFRWPAGEARHHLYLLADGADELRRHLRFRDALRADSALRERYAQLKRDIAARPGITRAAYKDAKGPFIAAVLARALR